MYLKHHSVLHSLYGVSLICAVRQSISFSIFLILPAALGSGVYYSSRNEYRSKKKKVWGVERGRRVRLTISLLFVSRLSRQCGILSISQPYRPPRPGTGIALLSLFTLPTFLNGNNKIPRMCVTDVNMNLAARALTHPVRVYS
jgi:hypothetical protein